MGVTNAAFTVPPYQNIQLRNPAVHTVITSVDIIGPASGGMAWATWADNSNSTGDNPDGTGNLDYYGARVTIVPEPAGLAMLAMTLLLASGRRCCGRG